MNITPNKLTIAQLFATPNEQFVVPSYQRRYAWGYHQYLALYEDIDMLKENDGHLFGMIILHTNYHTGGLNQPELVDGQQRMTTLVILLKAFEDAYRTKGKAERADEIMKMLMCQGLDEQRKPKIKLGDLDNKDIEKLLLHNDTENISNENILNAYKDYFKKLSALDIEKINRFFFKLTNIAVIIRLDVGMAQDAYKLFETINNRGLKLTPTDIIKNFLLGHAAKINQETTLDKVKELWSEIIINLDDIDTDDFLRHFICSQLHRKVTMSMLVYEFKKYYLKKIKQADLLGEYEYYQTDYETEEEEEEEPINGNGNGEGSEEEEIKETKIDIVEFLILLKDLSAVYRKIAFATFESVKIKRRIGNLNNILSKPSYIFLMHFLKGETHPLKQKLEVLKYIETLMLRRHICERRTSENDDIFSKMIPFIGSENILDQIKSNIDEGEFMPPDNEFVESFPKHEFKGKLIDRAKYVLESFEYAKRGNTDELVVSSSGEVELEHIIPQTINTKKSKEEFGDWQEYLGENSLVKHKKFVNLIGNMTLLGEALNIQAYNNPFAKKKNSYRKSSFLITQELANQNDFKFHNVTKRGEALTKTALEIWKL